MSKIGNLERIAWVNGTLLIMVTYAAYELTAYNHHLYMVLWWGDEPASFSLFEFTAKKNLKSSFPLWFKARQHGRDGHEQIAAGRKQNAQFRNPGPYLSAFQQITA